MSYRKRHIKNKVKKIRPKKSILKRPWFWTAFFILIAIVSFLYFLLFYPSLQVSNIIIDGNQKVKTAQLSEFVTNSIKIKLVDLEIFNLTTKSIFLINPRKLNRKVLEKFVPIEGISIKRNFPNTLILDVTERKPIAAYCVDSEANSQCFLIDQSGIIFEQLPFTPEGLTILKQLTGDNNIFVGQKLVEKNITEAISKIQKNLKDNFQLDLKEALITSPLRLDITTNENWQIYFNLGEDSNIDAQLVKLKLLLSGDILPETRRALQYIDLRFKDRVFYK